MTNREWVNSLSTEDFVYWLTCMKRIDNDIFPTLKWVLQSNKPIEEWLKEERDEKFWIDNFKRSNKIC